MERKFKLKTKGDFVYKVKQNKDLNAKKCTNNSIINNSFRFDLHFGVTMVVRRVIEI